MADLIAPLSNEERETLHRASWSPYLNQTFAAVEQIIAARLAEQRVGIAEAIEVRMGGWTIGPDYDAALRTAAHVARNFGEATRADGSRACEVGSGGDDGSEANTGTDRVSRGPEIRASVVARDDEGEA